MCYQIYEILITMILPIRIITQREIIYTMNVRADSDVWQNVFKTFDGLVLKESRMRTSKSVLISRRIDYLQMKMFCVSCTQIIDCKCMLKQKLHINHICWNYYYLAQRDMSLIVRKLDFPLCENKGADQLRSNCEADQHICFRYTDSTISLLLNPKFQASSLLL